MVIIMMDVLVIKYLYGVLELVRLFIWGGWGVSAFVRLRVSVPWMDMGELKYIERGKRLGLFSNVYLQFWEVD